MAKHKKKGSYNSKGAGRRGRISAIIALTMALLMLLTTVLGSIATVFADSKVDKLKSELSEVTQKKKDAQQEIENLKGKKNSILAEIEQIDAEIAAATREIELQQELIDELGEQIKTKEAELKRSEEKQDEQYEKLKIRVRAIHENGSMSYLSILLSSEDFADFLNRYEVASRISKYDKNLFEQLKAIKEDIARQKEGLETDRTEAVELKGQMQSNKNALEARMSERQSQMEEVESAESRAKELYSEIAEEEERLAEEIRQAVIAQAASSSSTYIGGSFMWPLPAANNVVTCKFGMRTHPITGVYKLHTGVDLRATSGTKIYAANSGTVTTAKYSSAYGNYVVVDHGGGVATLYAHMSKLNATKGQRVSQGDVIGYVGSTGYSTAPHLHFEIIKNGQYINPIDEFPNFSVVYK